MCVFGGGGGGGGGGRGVVPVVNFGVTLSLQKRLKGLWGGWQCVCVCSGGGGGAVEDA